MNKTIDSILLRVSPKTRETLIRYIDGTVDLYGKDFADALNELAELDRKTSASYEELMAEMFDDVLK